LPYFKNAELTKAHRVALNTVLNWIKSAEQGRLDLQLVSRNDRSYIANTAKNVQTLERLVAERKKYRNSRTARVVEPTTEFYRFFNDAQILDIISNLEAHHEIPRKYNYFDGGAEYWDEHAKRLVDEEAPNVINRTIQLLQVNQSYMDDLLAPYQRVNVIDIGVGNVLPVRELLSHLVELGVLGRYIALDVSHEILDIAKSNVEKWYGDRVSFEGHLVDIEYERFNSILADEYMGQNADSTINLVLFVGGTICNFRSPETALANIHSSMGRNDLFVHSQKLDTNRSRRIFDFTTTSSQRQTSLAPIHKVVFDLLNLDPLLYEVEMGYDHDKQQRFIVARPTVSLRFKFKYGTGERIVELEKGEAILVWRSLQQTAGEVLRELSGSHFYPFHLSQTLDREYLLTISQIDSGFSA
jgi:uncharacterized SAM-dependent methyltransferase